MLSPVFRRAFRLTLVQVGLLDQVLTWVAFVVEPAAASQIDFRSRRALMGFGAAALGVSVLVMAGAPTFGVLLAGFAAYGIGSGPLAHTADVVVLEMFPEAAERAYSRATFLDTVGALVGPLLIAAAGAVGVSWRVVLAMLGVSAVAYAYAIRRTPFPTSPRHRDHDRHLVREVVGNAATVLRDRGARQLLLVLLWFDVFEIAFLLKYVWLHETVGLSEPLVAAWAAGEQLVDLVALVILDRWLARRDGLRILQYAAGALVVLPAAWVAAPGVAGRVAIGIPLAFARTLVWPLAKSRSLTAVPELAGATQAITALFAILPLAILQARVAETIGVGPAMAATAAVGAALMVVQLRGES